MKLGDLITILSSQDQSLVVPFGFGDPHSYCGSYEHLSFEPTSDVAMSEMLFLARGALGKVFTGKGGVSEMNVSTKVFLSPRADATGVEISYGFISMMVKVAEEKRRKIADSNELVGGLGSLLVGCPSLPGVVGRQYFLDDVLRAAISRLTQVGMDEEFLGSKVVGEVLPRSPSLYASMGEHGRKSFDHLASICGVAGTEEISVVLGAVNNEIMNLRQKLEKSQVWRGLMEAADEQAAFDDYEGFISHVLRIANGAGITPLQAWLVFWNEKSSSICQYMKTGEPCIRPIVGDFVKVLNHLRFGWLLTLEAKDGVVAKGG